MPLKVVEPPLALRGRTDGPLPLLLIMLPPFPGVLSDSDATCWLTPFRSRVELAAIERAVAVGNKLLLVGRSWLLNPYQCHEPPVCIVMSLDSEIVIVPFGPVM